MRTIQGTTLYKRLSTKGRRETLEEAYYTQFGAPYQLGRQYRAAGQDTTNETMETLRQMSKVLQERGFRSLPSATETNPPVARIEAIRLFLAYASFKEFVIYQMDIKSAFRYGKIEEE
ncbi:copia protein, partial [Tanacetum coccineum]